MICRDIYFLNIEVEVCSLIVGALIFLGVPVLYSFFNKVRTRQSFAKIIESLSSNQLTNFYKKVSVRLIILYKQIFS